MTRSVAVATEFKKLCIVRVTYAVMHSMAMQWILFIVFQLLINFSLYHPLDWFGSSISVIFSFYTWLWKMPLLSAVIIYWIFLSKISLGTANWYTSRISKFRHNFLQIIGFFLMHIILGLLTAVFYASYLGDEYNSLAYKCRPDSMEFCLNERLFIFVLSGIAAGGYFFARDHHHTCHNKLDFPVIQTPKFAQIRAQFGSVLYQSLRRTLLPVLVFFMAYICFRGIVKSQMCSLFNLSEEDDTTILDVVFNLKLGFFTWILAAQIVSSMSFIKVVFQIFMTDYIEFPIAHHDEKIKSREITLVEAFSLTKVHLSVKLASLDLFTLGTRNVDPRRVELFGLSFPGGHPYNWQSLSTKCVEIVNEFQSEISKSLLKTVKKQTNAIGNANIPPATQMADKILRRQYNETIGIRNMLYYATIQEPVNNNNNTSQADIKISSIANYFRTKTALLQNYIANLPGIYYLFTQTECTKITHLLANCEHIIWIIQGMSALCALSAATPTEDKFGVVQDSLPSIIKNLIQLKLSVDEITPMDLGGKKFDRNYLRLKSAIKRSLYQMASVFGEYVDVLTTDPEHARILLNYSRHKEP